MKPSNYIYSLTLDLGLFGEQEVDVHYSYSAGRPAVMYLKNGDPGYPEEPAEIEVRAVVAGNGSIQIPSEWWETTACMETIIDMLSAYHSEDY